MKFCNKKHLTYEGLNNIQTSVDYVLLDDVILFHGKEFADKWLQFIKEKPMFVINNIKGYYYANYEYAARQTDSFLNPTG